MAEHRGGMVLVLGILSLVLCGPLGVLAWFMGARDLKKMRTGRMNREGLALTQAGYVCGVIGTIGTAITTLFAWLLFSKSISLGG